MGSEVVETKLPGVVLLEPAVFGDERGFSMKIWNKRRYEEAGVPSDCVRNNLSYSQRGVLRGLHSQNSNAWGKLVSMLLGEVFDVAVDVQAGSPSFGEWVRVKLSADNKRQLYVLESFVVTSEAVLFSYKCTGYYNREDECSSILDDPGTDTGWSTDTSTLSARDAALPRLAEFLVKDMPGYAGPTAEPHRVERT